jgi:hypothetical protein
MFATDENFRAIWDPYRSGLTSNVTPLEKEFRMIRAVYLSNKDLSDADLAKKHECPFLDVNNYIKQKAAGVTVDIKQLSSEQIREYSLHFDHLANIQTFHRVVKSTYSFQKMNVLLTLS